MSKKVFYGLLVRYNDHHCMDDTWSICVNVIEYDTLHMTLTRNITKTRQSNVDEKID